MTQSKSNPLRPPPAQRTVRAQKKAEAQAKAVADFEEKCVRMKAESARITAITNAAPRKIMTAQIEALDKDLGHFEVSRRADLVRQLRELDGLD